MEGEGPDPARRAAMPPQADFVHLVQACRGRHARFRIETGRAPRAPGSGECRRSGMRLPDAGPALRVHRERLVGLGAVGKQDHVGGDRIHQLLG